MMMKMIYNDHGNDDNDINHNDNAGFFVTLKNMPIYMHWMSYIAYVRYGFEGTMQAIYGFERPKLVCSEVNIGFCFCCEKY